MGYGEGAILLPSPSNHPATTAISYALPHLWQISGFATSAWVLSGALRRPLWSCLASKCADHLPLYRQALIFARSGVMLERSALACRVSKAAFHFGPS
jgi:hypothetical protein